MKRTLAFVLVAFAAISLLFAGKTTLSVPLTSDAYRIIENAEIRGIIPQQSQTRPYSVSLVRSLLSEILASDNISEGEKKAIGDLEKSLVRYYGEEKSGMSDVLKNGYLTLVDGEDSFVSIGARFSNTDSVAVVGDACDIRTKLTAYARGNFLDSLSFFMDLSLLLDKVDHRAFLVTDFQTECEGVYQDLMNGGSTILSSPIDGLGNGYAMSPEISASFADDALSIRFASVKRDWGPGRNNIALSASARSFDGIEFTYAPSSAFSVSWLLGSLGMSYLPMTGEAKPIGDPGFHSDEYDNNFSAQRIEVSPFKNLRAAIYETVVWRKRSELAYLNPIGIYMFAQNYIGDYDNVLAGIDLTYTLPGVGKAYFGLGLDELNSKNPKTFFSYARNIIAAQAGLKLNVPGSSFSLLTLQATYIPPFFGSHYKFSAAKNPWGNTAYEVDYVNKGNNLSYPLYPDSIELLAAYETTLPEGYSLRVVAKDQMRSAQFSTEDEDHNKYGTTIDTTMRYKVSSKYGDKHFFSYIWNNVLDVSATVTKAFDDFPVTLSFGLEGIVDSRCTYNVGKCTYSYTEDGVPGTATIVDGKHNTLNDDWSTTMRVVGHLGLSLYY